MMSGVNSFSAARNPRSESTRRVAPPMPARRSSRSTSAASSGTSSTRSMRIGAGITSARLLVQEHPVQSHLGDGPGERLEIHRLDDVAVGTQSVRRRDIGFLVGRREYDDRQRLGPLIGPEPPQNLEAVDLRELQIQEDYAGRDADVTERMRLLTEEEVERLRTVARHEDLVREVAGAEGPQGELHVVRVVLDQQDLHFRRQAHAVPPECGAALGSR